MIDGKGYSISGDSGANDNGITNLGSPINITIKNIKIIRFGSGMYLTSVKGSMFYNISISNSKYGMRLLNSIRSSFVNISFYNNLYPIFLDRSARLTFSSLSLDKSVGIAIYISSSANNLFTNINITNSLKSITVNSMTPFTASNNTFVNAYYDKSTEFVASSANYSNGGELIRKWELNISTKLASDGSPLWGVKVEISNSTNLIYSIITNPVIPANGSSVAENVSNFQATEYRRIGNTITYYSYNINVSKDYYYPGYRANQIINESTKDISFYLSPSFNFNTAYFPSPIVIDRGGTVNVEADAYLVSGPAQTVSFNAINLPIGISSITSSCGIICTRLHGCKCYTAVILNSTSESIIGNYSINFTASGGGITKVNSINLTIIQLPLYKPLYPKATGILSDSIYLEWSRNSSGGLPINYRIERSISSSGPWTEIAVISGSQTSYINSNLNASKSYYYRVRGSNSTYNTTYSSTFTGKTLVLAGQIIWLKDIGNNDSYIMPLKIKSLTNKDVEVVGEFFGNIDFGGKFLSNPEYSYFVSRYNSSGSLLWVKDIGPNQPIDLEISANGEIALLDQDEYFQDQVSRYNSSGSFMWKKLVNISSAESYAVSIDSSGNVYIAGTIEDPNDLYGPCTDVLVAKYAASTGVLSWKKQINGATNADCVDDVGNDIAVDASGNIYLTGQLGYYHETSTDWTTRNDLFIAKYTSSGTQSFLKKLIGQNYDEASGNEIAINPAGNSAIILGEIDFEESIIKYSSSGSLLWSKNLSFYKDFNEANGVALDNSGNSNVLWTNPYSFMSKFDSNGNILWANPSQNINNIDIAIDSNTLGNSLIIGTFSGQASIGNNNLISKGINDMLIMKVGP